MKKLAGYFFQGLLLVVPLAVTIYVIYFTFKFVDGLLPFDIPGIGLIVIIAAITLIGFITKLVITKPIISFFERIIKKSPLIKVVYSSVKDLLSAFVGKEKKFNNPVLVKISDDSDIERLGFITQQDLSNLGIKEKKIAVYLPSSYGILGELYIVPEKNITPVDMHSAEFMKYIVSGGVSK